MENADTVIVEGLPISPAKLVGDQSAFTADRLLFTKPRWVPDEEVTSCEQCQSRFSALKRKHHCRNCGHVFCAQCCKEKIALPHLGMQEPERICESCKPLAGTVIMALSKSVNIQFEAAEKLHALCKEPVGLRKCLEIGGLQCLVYLTSAKHSRVKLLVAQTIQTVCPQTTLHTFLNTCGVPEAICKLLRDADAKEQDLLLACIGVLTMLCKTYDMRSVVLACSPVEPLLLLLATTTCDAMSLVALQCLSLLLDHPDSYDAVCDKERKTTLSKILNLCKNADEQVQEVSLRILANVSCGKDWHRQRIVQEDMFSGGVLASVLDKRPNNVQLLVNAACLVANLASAENTQGSLGELLAALCQLVGDYSTHTDLLVHIARAVANIAKHKQNCDNVESRLPLVLRTFLKSRDQTTKDYGFQIVILMLTQNPTSTINHLQKYGVADFLYSLAGSTAVLDTARQSLSTSNPAVVKPRVL